jgi:hypothetical protein
MKMNADMTWGKETDMDKETDMEMDTYMNMERDTDTD